MHYLTLSVSAQHPSSLPPYLTREHSLVQVTIYPLLIVQKKKLKEGVEGEKKKKKKVTLGPDGEKIIRRRKVLNSDKK